MELTIQEITISFENKSFEGHLSFYPDSKAWVIFAHGSGSSRLSPRNNWVSRELNQHGYGTLLFDLLTPQEDLHYKNRFNLPLLASRLEAATQWLLHSSHYQSQPLAYFGASTGAGAALIAASHLSSQVPLFTVISRGGRPDLAGEEVLKKVTLPVFLIVGSLDHEVIKLNDQASTLLPESELQLIEGATHLFEERGKLSEVLAYSLQWLDSHLPRSAVQKGEGHAIL